MAFVGKQQNFVLNIFSFSHFIYLFTAKNKQYLKIKSFTVFIGKEGEKLKSSVKNRGISNYTKAILKTSLMHKYDDTWNVCS